MAQTAIDFYFIGLLVERGGIGEGLRDAALQVSLFLVETVCVFVCVCTFECQLPMHQISGIVSTAKDMTPALQKTSSRWMDGWTGGSGHKSFKLNGRAMD